MRILWLSDFDLKGSGYMNISVPLCDGLAKRGHEVKAIGLGYDGREHWWDFSLIPAKGTEEGWIVLQNLVQTDIWEFDVLVVALDIMLHEKYLVEINKKYPNREWKYVGIMPVEADPLSLSWAALLMQMDKALIISEFGTQEAIDRGVDAEYLPIGIDMNAWEEPTEDQRNMVRKNLGISEDDFVILTVADNQERKNLSRSMEIISDFMGGIETPEKIKYILVTREHLPFGWKLRDLAGSLGLNNNVMIFERGIPFSQLWSIYATADLFLLTSKAEGLGMPLLEAMSMGIPCMGTECTAIEELLGDGRGLLIEPDYQIIDPFGNGNRYFASIAVGSNLLNGFYSGRYTTDIEGAKQYIAERPWSVTLDNMEKALKAAVGEDDG